MKNRGNMVTPEQHIKRSRIIWASVILCIFLIIGFRTWLDRHQVIQPGDFTASPINSYYVSSANVWDNLPNDGREVAIYAGTFTATSFANGISPDVSKLTGRPIMPLFSFANTVPLNRHIDDIADTIR